MLKKKAVLPNQSTFDYKGNKKFISNLSSEKNSTRNFFKIHAS